MLFRLLHSLRRRQLWLVFGGICIVLAARAYSGEGVEFMFGGSSIRLLFAALGGVGLATAGYWISRSTYSVFRASRVALPLVIATALLTSGGVLDVPALIDHYVGREMFAALVYLAPCVIGCRYVMQLKRRKTGHWSPANRPER